jgi:hypothetical protein
MDLKKFAQMKIAAAPAPAGLLKGWKNTWKPGMAKHKSYDMRPFFKAEGNQAGVPTSSKLWDRGMVSGGGKQYGGARRAGTR